MSAESGGRAAKPGRNVPLAGVFPALTTPLEDQRCALGRLADNIAVYLRQGVAGFVVLGSTGEAPLLDEGEKLAVLRAARAAIPSSHPMIAGVGLESTAGTIELAIAAAGEGADAVLVGTPCYFRSRMSETALVRHFAAVADACPAPVLLYNVPKFTGLEIPITAVATLAGHPGIAGLKDSSGNLEWLGRVLAVVPRDFTLLCGASGIFAQAVAAGAAGGILAAADVMPEAYAAVWEHARDGRAERAEAIQQRLEPAAALMVSALGVAGVKAGVEERGLFGGVPRLPLLPLDQPDGTRVRQALDDLVDQGLLAALRMS